MGKKYKDFELEGQKETMVLPERAAFYRGDGSGAGSSCGAGGQRAVADYGVAAQAEVGARA